jgi:hypothetical protein
MAKDKEQLKKEYNEKHGYSSADQFGQIAATFGTGGLADKEDDGIIGEDGSPLKTTRRQTGGTIHRAGSVREQYRGEREHGREDEFSSGSLDTDTQRFRGMDRGSESASVVDVPSDRIINVATTKQRTTRTKREPERKKEEVRAVVVDVLKGPDVETTRKRLRIAFVGLFKAADDFINISLKEKPPQPLIIWTGIDDADIDTLVEARIARAQHSVIEARIVKSVISIYEQFATGLITMPRIWQSYVAYHIYGFELPGASMFPGNRRRRNLHVVDSRDEPKSGTSTP